MKKPATKKEWAAFRAQLTCNMGKKEISHAIDNNLCLEKATAVGLYHLLNAIHDLALLEFDPTSTATIPNNPISTSTSCETKNLDY